MILYVYPLIIIEPSKPVTHEPRVEPLSMRTKLRHMRLLQGSKRKRRKTTKDHRLVPRRLRQNPNTHTNHVQRLQSPRHNPLEPRLHNQTMRQRKKINNCTECPDFICTKLDAFQNDAHKSHHQAVENLKQIKKTGLQQWIKNNASK